MVAVQLGHHQHGKTGLLRKIVHAAQDERPESVMVPPVTSLAEGAMLDRDRLAQRLPWRLEPGFETQRARLVYYETPLHRVVHFDVPGRADLVPEVLRILHEADVAVVVVSARRSVEAQTKEHLETDPVSELRSPVNPEADPA